MVQNAAFVYVRMSACLCGFVFSINMPKIKMHANGHFMLFTRNELLLSPYMCPGWFVT